MSAIDVQQVIYALQRQIRLCRFIGERCTSPDNPYGGLLWHDEAGTLEEAVTLLTQEKRIELGDSNAK